MDDNVLAAMARWPDVPNVYGWLSLSESGHWRLHPMGDACIPATGNDSPDSHHGAVSASQGPSRGEGITSPQILRFIDHNYAHDEKNQWFFQNGPQKVYVRLDAAPYILHTETASPANPSGLMTHNGLAAGHIREWCLDEAGRLYAQTQHGPGLIAGRDLACILERLYTTAGEAILEVLERVPDRKAPLETEPLKTAYPRSAISGMQAAPPTVATPFRFASVADIPALLGFVRRPMPPQ